MDEPQYGQALLVSLAIAGIVFLLALIVQRRRPNLPQLHPAFVLPCTCLFLAWFVVHFGRHQFGGYDFNLLLETGWRQVQGQRPYVDFPTTLPPGFNLGILLAFRLFGVSWDANLYLTAAFTCLTFLWLFWLFRRLAVPGPAAFTAAIAIESSANLLLSFWWYNSATLTLAAVFFLSTLLCARTLLAASRLPGPTAQLSLVLSLALLALFKPNLAALVLLPGVLVLLTAASPWLIGHTEPTTKARHPERSAQHEVEGPRESLRHPEIPDHSTTELPFTSQLRNPQALLHILALLLAATTLAAAILALNGISIPLLLSVYRGVASERGLTLIGFSLMQPLEKLLACLWLSVLSIPLLALVPHLRSQLAQRDLRALAATLFLFTGPLLALYGIAANGEFRSVECAVLLAASTIAVFAPGGRPPASPRLRRATLAILCASIASDLYLGVIRLRVAGVGPHMFFEWRDHQNLIATGVLRNMRVSATMLEVEREVALARAADPGPLFFGPRVDFNYAVLGLPSPAHLPAWWQPGTAFPRSATPALLATWGSYRFPTLIFLKDDTTYYPDEFLDLIQSNYTRDDRYPALTVYHRHPITAP